MANIHYRSRRIDRFLTRSMPMQICIMLALFGIMGFAFYIALRFSGANTVPAEVNGWGWWVYIHMVDAGTVIESVKQGVDNRWITGIGLFMNLFCILLFGGIFISIFTSFFEESGAEVKKGKCRYKITRFEKLRTMLQLPITHYVILGWDAVGASIVHRLLENKKPIVILSSSNPEDIRNDIDSYDADSEDSSDSEYLYILNGSFTNAAELTNETLALDKAEKIYVLGEKDSVRRDSDTVYVAVNNEHLMKKCKGTEVIANINDFSIYSQLKNIAYKTYYFNTNDPDKEITEDEHEALKKQYEEAKKRYDELPEKDRKEKDRPKNLAGMSEDRRYVDVTLFNFYENWARRIWSSTVIGKPENDNSAYYCLAHSPIYRDSYVHAIIIGFGKMGQALAVEAARVAHYGNGKKTLITIIDDQLDEKRKRDFTSVFGLTEVEDGRYSWKNVDGAPAYTADVEFEFIDKRASEPEIRQLLIDAAKDENQIVTIAVTFSDLDAALDLTLSLPIEITSEKGRVPILLRNENDRANEPFGLQKAKCSWGSVKFFGNLKECTDIDEKMEDFANMLNAIYALYERDEAGNYKRDSINPDNCWRYTSEYNRWSSRHQAFAFIERLRSIGYSFAKTDNEMKNTSQELTRELVNNGREDWEKLGKDVFGEKFEDYCIAEHDRWSVEKWLDGWSYGFILNDKGEKSKDNKNRKHPCLVKYEELSQKIKDLDIRPLALSKWILENYCGITVTKDISQGGNEHEKA